MKRWVQAAFFILLGTFLLAPPVRAEELEAGEYEWHDKLKRGFLNVVTSPVEIPRNIDVTSREKNLSTGWTVGIVKGLGSMIIRLGAGLVDLVTFPFEFPGENRAPLIEPEYVWENPGVD